MEGKIFRTFCFSLLMPVLAAGAGTGSSNYVRIERLSERVLLAYWIGTGRCNLTVIQSQKGLVIIDTEMSPRIMEPIKQKIERAFGRNDWAYVINTHAHMHHTGGNCLFKGATVVGHENLPEDMQWLVDKQVDPEKKSEDLERAARTIVNLRAVLPRVARNPATTRIIRGEIRFWQLYIQDVKAGYEVVKPSLTFADRHALDLGDLKLELVFFGRGHSISDILVYVPEEKLLVTGAIVYQRRQLPEIGEHSQMEDLERFMSVLDSFLAEDVQIDRVVPSHSPPLLKSDLVPVRDFYQKMLTGVRSARAEGLTLEEVIGRFSVRAAFPYFRDPQPGQWDYGMQQRNLRNLWRILEEQDQAKQIPQQQP